MNKAIQTLIAHKYVGYTDYEPQTVPWPHQDEAFAKSKDEPLFALFMEPRTGKTKVIIDTACRKYQQGALNGMLIVAWGSGVHHNWVADELPIHWRKGVPWSGFVWRSRDAKVSRTNARGQKIVGKRSYNNAFDAMLEFKGFKIFAINAEALSTGARGLHLRTWIGRFIKACDGKVMGVADESIFMQTPNKPRSKVMMSIAKHCIMRRILDGTPVSNQGPLGLYTQVGFLDKGILGFPDFVSFRAHYAEVERQGDYQYNVQHHLGLQVAADEGTAYKAWLRDPKKNHQRRNGVDLHEAFADDFAIANGGKAWPAIARDDEGKKQWRNIDELNERLEPYSYRCRFREVFKDVPIPVYQPKYFELTTEQRRVYNDLAEEYAAELRPLTDASRTVLAANVLARYLRLQQVTSNYWPSEKRATPCSSCTPKHADPTRMQGVGCVHCDGLGVIVKETGLTHIDNTNPRIEAALEALRGGDQWIVWARFDQEIDEIIEGVKALGATVGRYDGKVNADQKYETRTAFQNGKLDILVAKGSSAGRGIPLWKARGAITVSCGFSLSTYQQMEMRTEIEHRRVAAELIHIIAEDTIDDNVIIPSLRGNMDIAARIMNDPRRDWISGKRT